MPIAIRTPLQKKRAWFQLSFFTLFIVAPILDIFRLDLNLGHFIFFGQNWTLGLADFQHGLISTSEAVTNLLLRAFLPLLVIFLVFFVTSWKWGRLYCGWLCPHYSVLEVINRFMFRASGKPSIWEKKPLPVLQADGRILNPDRIYWLMTVTAIFAFAFLWAVTLLTYLLPPAEIYPNLFSGELTRNQFTFISVATILLTIEFAFARHLFCRFGCAVGLFQSLVWMANSKAMVVDFKKEKAISCRDCNNACDNACPMRLQPRNLKRKMFTCTECGECISACTQVQNGVREDSLLEWVQGLEAQARAEPPIQIPGKRVNKPSVHSGCSGCADNACGQR